MDDPLPKYAESISGICISDKHKFDPNVYLKGYKYKIAKNLGDINLETQASVYGPERILTAFFVSLFGYTRAQYFYPYNCTKMIEGPPEHQPLPDIHILYAYQALQYINDTYFDPADLEEVNDIAFEIYKQHADQSLFSECDLLKSQYDKSSGEWDRTFYRLESTLLEHCCKNFLELFYCSFYEVLEKIPGKLKKSPFRTTKDRKEFCSAYIDLLNKPNLKAVNAVNRDVDQTCYLEPWFIYLNDFSCSRRQYKYTQKVYEFYRAKYDEKSFFYQDISSYEISDMKDVLFNILFMMTEIWHIKDMRKKASHRPIPKTRVSTACIPKQKSILPDPTCDQQVLPEQAPEIKALIQLPKKKNKFGKLPKLPKLPHFNK